MLRSTPACQQREPSGETNTNHHDTQSNCRTRGCEAMRLYSKLCQELAARTTSEPHRNRCLQSRWVTWPRHSRGQEAKHQCDRRRHIIWMICRNERIEPATSVSVGARGAPAPAVSASRVGNGPGCCALALRSDKTSQRARCTSRLDVFFSFRRARNALTDKHNHMHITMHANWQKMLHMVLHGTKHHLATARLVAWVEWKLS